MESTLFFAVLATFSLFGLVLGAFKLGRMSRPTTTLSAAPYSETTLIVGSEFRLPSSNLDEYHVELGERKVAAKGWGKMPPRIPKGEPGAGRFQKKQVD